MPLLRQRACERDDGVMLQCIEIARPLVRSAFGHRLGVAVHVLKRRIFDVDVQSTRDHRVPGLVTRDHKFVAPVVDGHDANRCVAAVVAWPLPSMPEAYRVVPRLVDARERWRGCAVVWPMVDVTVPHPVRDW